MTGSYWTQTLAKRVTRRRGLAVTGALATSAAFFAACGGDGGGESKPETPKGSGALSPIVDETKSVKRGGIFPAIQITPQPSIDPHLVGGAVAFTWHAYSQLFRPKEGYMEPASGEFEGELAESWELSPDKTQITVKLKQGVKFAPKPPVNARDLDASDIIFSWNRFKSISPRAGELSNERSPNAPVLSLTQIDNRTISIKTKEPLATILGGFAGSLPGNFWIVPREAEDTSKLDLKGQSAGTGPFYLAEYSPSVGSKFRRNPAFKAVDSRDLPYIEGIDYFDLPEYANQLAQFRSGNVLDWFFGVQAADILSIKKDVPALEVYDNGLSGGTLRMFFGHATDSPFKDERVRQATSMSWDRNLYIEVAFETKKFEGEGLPMNKAWDSATPPATFPAVWLDPQGKDFGPNARYFKYDLAESKKLMSAAGVTAPLESDFIYALTFPPITYRRKDFMLGLLTDSGNFKPKIKELDFATEWTPKFRLNKGQFNGFGVELDTLEPDFAADLYSHYNSAGSRFFGGDATLDDLTGKMLKEFDLKKRVALAQELQKHDAMKQFRPSTASATSFRVAWPAHRNRRVWQGNGARFLAHIFIDPDKPPLKKS